MQAGIYHVTCNAIRIIGLMSMLRSVPMSTKEQTQEVQEKAYYYVFITS